jgi:hypothetical protein
MLAALLLAAPLAWGAEGSSVVTRLEVVLAPSMTARRLFAAAADVERREAHASGLRFAVDERGGDAPEIVVDLERIGDLPPGEAVAEYARALSLAEIASPVPLIEAEQASRQWTAQVLLEAVAEDPSLSKELQAAERAPASGAPVLARAAAFIGRFEREPQSAWRSVESDGGAPREAVRLTDLEDLFALHAAAVRALKAPPEGEYGTLDYRRYPGARVRAAYRLRSPGAVARLREALGAYDTVGVEPLKRAIFLWRRALQTSSR